MKINVASFGGRSHLLDLSRELAKLGHDVKFYSYTPTIYAKRFGLNPKNNSKFWMLTMPYILLAKKIGFNEKLRHWYRCIYDVILSFYMRKCDIFIGQVPMSIVSSKIARKKGALIIIESGLSHINEYNYYLQKFNIKKENIIGSNRYHECYNIADYITVASKFVKEGFINNGINKEKIFINPYGVDYSCFKSTILSSNPYDAIVVGQWSKRKGVELIIEVAKKTNIKVLHVGSIVDVDFPQEENFKHINTVPEKDLILYYQQAKYLLFPSYEDGFGLVLIQALICGLPIICSKHTGGPTLKDMITNKDWIIEMDDINTESLESCINKAEELSQRQKGIRNYVTEQDLKNISWEAYGKRYDNFLKEIYDRHKK